MNDSIYPGAIFANYRDLCRAIGAPILRGRSQQFQLERWKHQFTWERIPRSNKIAILPFEPPPPKESKRMSWEKGLSPQILHELVKTLKGQGPNPQSKLVRQLIIASTEAYVMLGLCNGRHASLKAGAELLDISFEQQHELWNKGRAKFADVFRRTLESLSARHLIYFERTYLIEDSPTRTATEEERAGIHLIIGEVLRLKEFNAQSEAQIFASKKDLPFYTEVNKRCKATLELQVAYKVFKIFFTEESLAALEQFSLKHTELQEYKERVNDSSVRWHLLHFDEKYTGALSFVLPILTNDAVDTSGVQL